MTFLTTADKQDFERDGFLVMPALFTPTEIAEIQGWTAEIESLPEQPGDEMKYFESSALSGARILQRVENFYPYHEGFRSLFDSPRVIGAVSELFGEPAVLFKDKINFKLPGGDGFKPHQDQQAGWGTYADLFVTILITIDESRVENGCLELVAGHHHKALLGNEWEPLNESQMDGMIFKAYPMAPGDSAFFDSYAPHGSKPNLTQSPRRSLYITYNRASDGDHRAQYFADKRKSFPPDCEREAGKEYVFRV